MGIRSISASITSPDSHQPLQPAYLGGFSPSWGLPPPFRFSHRFQPSRRLWWKMAGVGDPSETAPFRRESPMTPMTAPIRTQTPPLPHRMRPPLGILAQGGCFEHPALPQGGPISAPWCPTTSSSGVKSRTNDPGVSTCESMSRGADPIRRLGASALVYAFKSLMGLGGRCLSGRPEGHPFRPAPPPVPARAPCLNHGERDTVPTYSLDAYGALGGLYLP